MRQSIWTWTLANEPWMLEYCDDFERAMRQEQDRLSSLIPWDTDTAESERRGGVVYTFDPRDIEAHTRLA